MSERPGEDLGVVRTEPIDSELAAKLRGFGPIGLLAILLVVSGNFVLPPLSALLVLVWARASRTPWREIGYVRPSSWTRDILLGAAVGIALKLLMKAVVMPLLHADPINQRFQHLVGNPGALAATLPLLVVASWGEETFFRGYFFERLGKLLGGSVAARVTIVALTSALFGLAHEGTATMQQAALNGLALGTLYAIQRRIWFVTFVHIAFNVTAAAIIYANLETRIARLFFP